MPRQLSVICTPAAKRDEILGWQGARLRVTVKAPAQEGRANEAVKAVLARAAGCASRELVLTHGHHGRHKLFLVSDQIFATLEAAFPHEPAPDSPSP